MPVFVVNKPLGLSSHDVVRQARRLLNTKKVGHAGTLDPLASGVLVILSEDATKLSNFLLNSNKEYLAYVSFGASSPTLDAEGPITASSDATGLSKLQIEEAALEFLNMTEQVPPQYSAIKQSGVKGYEAARAGKSLDLPARASRYYEIELLAFAKNRDFLPAAFEKIENKWQVNKSSPKIELPQTLGDYPTALFRLNVKAGTYIRSFARDLGKSLNQESHLSALIRTKAGKSCLSKAIKIDQLPGSSGQSPIEALPYPLVELSDEEARRVKQGQRLRVTFENRVGLTNNENLIAVAENVNGKMKLLRVWN